uniref:alpha-glucosidase n=1 Tax=Timema shepardi TaxID=629360 RepID=A0A7R9B0G6_TIMSH|nr:unnamed protein product [Timema shepardi]
MISVRMYLAVHSSMGIAIVLFLLALTQCIATLKPSCVPGEGKGEEDVCVDLRGVMNMLPTPQVHTAPSLTSRSVDKPPNDVPRYQNSSVRIGHGNPAYNGQFSHQVFVTVDHSSYCAGSLVSRYWVLTTAQCVKAGTSYILTLGVSNISVTEAPALIISTRIAVAHQLYNKIAFSNNIGVIKIEAGVDFNQYIRPVCLPRYSDVNTTYEQQEVQVSGWGYTCNGHGVISDHLLYVDTRVSSNSECEHTFGKRVVTASTLCVSGRGLKGPLYGDSGSPTVINMGDGEYTQIGITSFVSEKACSYAVPSGHTRLTSYLDWIQEHTDKKYKNIGRYATSVYLLVVAMAKVLLVLVSAFLVSATVALPVQEELDWWQKTVIYQIYPRSYRDSDGNGVGDLRGIWQRVKPIKDAGAGAIWLSPIYESPMKDFGYDIINQTVIDPLFGNMEDFMDLMNITHLLGMKLILDFVPDYSSDQHEWFQKSVKRIDPYTDYYIWHDGKVDNETGERSVPNNWVSAFEGSAWSWNEDRQQYYYHVFTVEQPDLNYRNEFLVEDMKNVMRYWLDMGVDGFRVDSVPHLFEDTKFLDEPLSHDPNALEGDYDSLVHIYTQNLPETYDMVYQFRAVVDEYKKKDGVTRVMMTEAYETINQTMLYYGTDERPGAHFTFNFLFIRNLTENSTADDYDYIIHHEIPSTGFCPQVGNHDNHRAASRFPHLADAINMIAQLLPGTAVTYMGEEIAMEDTFISWEQTVDPPGLNAGPERYQLFSRDPERTPYQWDNTTSAVTIVVLGHVTEGYSLIGSPSEPAGNQTRQIAWDLSKEISGRAISDVIFQQRVLLNTKQAI